MMQKRARHHAWFAGVLLIAVSGPSAGAADPVIVDARAHDVLGGRFSPFARFQARLQAVLDACNLGEPAVVPHGFEPSGRIGAETRQGVQRALACATMGGVPADSPATEGIITASVWRAVMGAEPVPGYRERASALVLSFEATDFGDKPEWNFCQDSQGPSNAAADPRAPGFICYNRSDPCSYLTWGPRGATAGAGREIQSILWVAAKRDRELVAGAFGGEFRNLQRLFRLRSDGPKGECAVDSPAAHFLCAIWADPVRRKIWEDALAALGRSPLVRQAYAELYASADFDGDKLRAFADLWQRLKVPISEIDYAFFLDRVTHLGGPPDDEDATADALLACMRRERSALSVNAAARRCLARLQPHPHQAEFRLARDVAYYIDFYPEGSLSKKEKDAWESYIPLSAGATFALSDLRPAKIAAPSTAAALTGDQPKSDVAEISPAELNACPASVFETRRLPAPRR